MFKILALIGVIYLVMRYQDIRKLNKPEANEKNDEYIDYEEVD